MNTRKKQELLSLLRQYKINNKKRLNEQVDKADVLTKAINKKLKQLKIPKVLKPNQTILFAGAELCKGKTDIKGTMLGLVIKQVEYQVRLTVDDNLQKATLTLVLIWNHPKNSDGYRIDWVYENGKWSTNDI